ncbi:hypothetical protein AMS68_004553 [Peltaster fructicola]|uniref:Wax synthase domain-containing protein n=1 Tax=Peltaster fructicola TaxID=286661 RepID=A0A6H0XWH8_9PEZI|nr:hypothetical protein AMS68_004553 [Peltaster fructicola]
MLPPGLKSPREVTLYYDQVYFNLIDSGKAYPFTYPWCTLGALLIIVYLLFDHRHSRLWSYTRFPVFALLCVIQAWYLFTNKARNPASAFGVGLISSFGTLWVAAHLIANDCQTDYKRIERRQPTLKKPNGSTTSQERQSTLYWQGYPETLVERLDWILDMFFSFRGVGWSWQTNGVPSPPQWVTDDLNGQRAIEQVEPMTVSKTGIRRISSRMDLLKDALPKAIFGYFALDALKTIVSNDAYFLGYTDAPAPTFYPDFARSSYFLTKSSRLIITMTSVITALGTIFKLGPIFFAGILGPRWYGLRGEAWMNPVDYFGSFNNVLDKGLSGLWGGWWHQTFRFAFEAPATKVLSITGIDKRSQTGKMLSLFIAFFLSGVLHACGSHTQLGDTRPLLGPMSFFLSQGLGIVLETLASDTMKVQNVKLPKLLQRSINLVFVIFWLYHTAPLLADDFAQGGVWLFEPVPFSVFRGLGFGPADAGWWCWWDGVAWWRNGNTWWDTGIAL